MVSSLKESFQGSSSVICVGFSGVNVEKITQFRRELQQASANYRVVKNTLTKLAIKETEFETIDQFLVGPTGIIFCPEEIAESAKIVKKFAQDTNGALEIKGGIIEGAFIDAKGVEKVATLPSRQELLAQLVAALQSPISGLVGTLQGVLREFVFTLKAIADKKSEEQ